MVALCAKATDEPNEMIAVAANKANDLFIDSSLIDEMPTQRPETVK